jgi:hypothetical protein
MHKEINSTLNMGNVCQNLVYYVLSFGVLSKITPITIFKYIVLPYLSSFYMDVTLKKRTYAESVGEYGAEEVFGPEREELTRDYRKLRNEELHDLYDNQLLLLLLLLLLLFLLAQQPPVGRGLLIHEASKSHTTTHHSR